MSCVRAGRGQGHAGLFTSSVFRAGARPANMALMSEMARVIYMRNEP